MIWRSFVNVWVNGGIQTLSRLLRADDSSLSNGKINCSRCASKVQIRSLTLNGEVLILPGQTVHNFWRLTELLPVQLLFHVCSIKNGFWTHFKVSKGIITASGIT